MTWTVWICAVCPWQACWHGRPAPSDWGVSGHNHSQQSCKSCMHEGTTQASLAWPSSGPSASLCSARALTAFLDEFRLFSCATITWHSKSPAWPTKRRGGGQSWAIWFRLARRNRWSFTSVRRTWNLQPATRPRCPSRSPTSSASVRIERVGTTGRLSKSISRVRRMESRRGRLRGPA